MAKIQRVKKVHLWSLPKILAMATLAAILSVSCALGSVLIFQLVIDRNFGSHDILLYGFPILGTILWFGLPATVAIRYHPRFRRWWHGFFFGAIYGLAGLATGAFIEAAINSLRFGSGRLTGVIPRPSEMLRAASMLSIVSGGLFTLLWAASRRSRGKLKIVHGTQCPTCEYNLVGNTTYICPECGEPFTLEELDISADDLKPG